MSRSISIKRQEMGEEVWEEYQKDRKNRKALRYQLKNSIGVVNWRKNSKTKLILENGGKCIKCGYNKVGYSSAFHFHHRDPKTKLFGIGGKTKDIEKLREEIKKCDLLCANCHAEIHDIEHEKIRKETIELYKSLKYDQIEKILDKKTTIKREFKRSDRKAKEAKECLMCHNNFLYYRENKDQMYCSKECSAASKRKVNRPSSEDLRNMLQEKSLCAIGREFGVSDNAVRKWAKIYDLIK